LAYDTYSSSGNYSALIIGGEIDVNPLIAHKHQLKIMIFGLKGIIIRNLV